MPDDLFSQLAQSYLGRSAPSQPVSKIRQAADILKAKGITVPDDVVDDFDAVTGHESGRSHYTPGGQVKRGVATGSGEQAIGYSQVMPSTAKPYQRYGLDPFKELDNIAIGLSEFHNGADDPIGRRIAYVAGPKAKALNYYRKTGEVPDWKLYSYLPNNKETFRDYVNKTGGFNSVFSSMAQNYLATDPFQASAADYVAQPEQTPVVPQTTTPTAPVLEAPDTIQAQVTSAVDPQSPRAAVLTTDPSQNAVFGNRDGFTAFPTPQGTLWVNDAKAKKLKLKTQQDVQLFLDKNPDGMTRLIGKVENVPDTTKGVAVQTTKGGVEQTSSVVTSPETAQAQIAVDQQAHPGSTSQVMPVQDAIATRVPGHAEYVLPDSVRDPNLPQPETPQVPGTAVKPSDIFEQVQSGGSARAVRHGVRPQVNAPALGYSEQDFKDWADFNKVPQTPETRKSFEGELAQSNKQGFGKGTQAGINPADFTVDGRSITDIPRVNAPQEIQEKDAGGAYAEVISIPQTIKTSQDASAYALKQLQAKYPTAQFVNPQLPPDWVPGDPIGITYNTLQGAGVDTAPLIHQKGVENRVENPKVDLRVGKDWVQEDAQWLKDNIGERGAEAVGIILGGGGDTAKTLAGMARYIPAFNVSDINGDLPVDKIQDWSDSMRESTDALRDKTAGEGIVSQIMRIADPSALSRLVLLSELPGGAITALGIDRAAVKAGTKGSSNVDVLKEFGKGATIGAILHFSPLGGKLAQYGTARVIRSPLGISIVDKAGTILATVGGVNAAEKAFGANDDEAFRSAMVAGVLQTYGMLKGKLIGQRIRVKSKDGKQSADATITPEGEIKLLKGQEGKPFVETFVDVVPDEQGIYRAPNDTDAVNRGNVLKSAPQGNPIQNPNPSETATPLRESDINAQRIDTPDPAAVQKAQVDNRTRKVADALQGKDFIGIDEIAKATRLNKTNVEDAVMTLYGAGQVELLPGNRVRLINSEEIAKQKDLYERAKNYGQEPPPEAQTSRPKPAPVAPSSGGTSVPPTQAADVSAEPSNIDIPEPQRQAMEAAAQYKGRSFRHPNSREKLTFTGDINPTGTLVAIDSFGRERSVAVRDAEKWLGDTEASAANTEAIPPNTETSAPATEGTATPTPMVASPDDEKKQPERRAATGARVGTAEGKARVETAKTQLREIINNPDIVGKQRADAIANGKNLVQFLEANQDTRKPLETDYYKGDQIAYTGEPAPDGFRSFIYLEGAKAGAYGEVRTDEARQADVAKSQQEHRDFQAGMARVRAAQQQAQSPPPETDTAPAPIEKKRKPTATKHKSLSQFVRAHGGIRPTKYDKGEGKRISNRETGTTGLINKNSKYTAEHMAEIAWEAGYLRNDWPTIADRNGDELMGHVEDDLHGIRKHYPMEAYEDFDTDIADKQDEYYAKQAQKEQEALDYQKEQEEVLTKQIPFITDPANKEILDRMANGEYATDSFNLPKNDATEQYHSALEKAGIPHNYDLSTVRAYKRQGTPEESVPGNAENADRGEPQGSDARRLEELSPVEQARLRRTLAPKKVQGREQLSGLIAQHYNISRDELAKLQPLGEVGKFGQTSHVLKRELGKPENYELFNEFANIFAPELPKATANDFEELGNRTADTEDILTVIASNAGLPRSSHMDAAEWQGFLDEFGPRLSDEGINTILSALEHQQAWHRNLARFLNDPALTEMDRKVYDIGQQFGWAPLTNAHWGVVKPEGFNEDAPAFDLKGHKELVKLIKSVGKSYGREKLGDVGPLSDTTIKEAIVLSIRQAAQEALETESGNGPQQAPHRQNTQKGSDEGRSRQAEELDDIPFSILPTTQTDTPAFKKWFGDSKVVDDAGEPLVVYHGTTHDFDTFDPDRTNIENHFGKGIYLTDSPTDVAENYAGEGPDLTQRIEREAENIFQDLDKDYEYGTPAYDKAMEQARAEAKRKIAGPSEGMTMPLYAKIEKPVYIGVSGKQTRIDPGYESFDEPEPEQYDGEGDETQEWTDWDERRTEFEESQYDVESPLIQAVQRASRQYDDIDLDKVLEDLQDFTMDGGTADRLDKILRESEGAIYATDDEGNLASHDFIKDIFRNLGYDGIIMDADQAFGSGRTMGKQMAMDYGTKHYIVFESKQVKSAIGNNGDFDPNNPNILFTAQPNLFGGTKETVEQKSLFDFGEPKTAVEGIDKKTSDFLTGLTKSSDKTIKTAAQTIIGSSRFVNKQAIADAVDALDAVAKARHIRTDLNSILAQQDLSGKTVGEQMSSRAKEFAQAIEAGTLGRKLGEGNIQFQAAWHGSPHVFDKFDISKVGTGEGATAYGHGLYFATEEEVADHYRKGVSMMRQPRVTNIKLDEYKAHDLYGDLARRFSLPIKLAHKIYDLATKGQLEHVTIPTRLKNEVERETGWTLTAEPTGHDVIKGAKYKVDLKPEPSDYLLWDKPLSEQSERVKKALAQDASSSEWKQYQKDRQRLDELDNAGELDTPEWNATAERMRTFRDAHPLASFFEASINADKEQSDYLDSLPAKARPIAERMLADKSDNLTNGTHDDDWKQLGELAPDIDHNAIHTVNYIKEQIREDGKDIYRELSQKLGDAEASEYLHSLGIRGIKYLDGTSRGKGEGSFNYVLFDQSDIQILDINGTPITLLEDDAANAERLIDTLRPDIESLRNGSNSKTVSEKGFGSLNIPVQDLSLARMFRLAQNPQIREAIIKAIPVDVVNLLKSTQLTPEMLLHQPTVFRDLLSIDRDNPIPLLVDVSGRTPNPETAVRTVNGVTAAASKRGSAARTDADRMSGDRGSVAGSGTKLSSTPRIQELRNGLATATAKVLAHTDIIQPDILNNKDVIHYDAKDLKTAKGILQQTKQTAPYVRAVKAKYAVEPGIVQLDPNALSVMNDAVRAIDERYKNANFTGAYLNPRATTQLQDVLNAGVNAAMAQGQPKVASAISRAAEAVEKGTDPSHGDLILAVNIKQAPQMSRHTMQEELGHRNNARTGARDKFQEIDATPALTSFVSDPPPGYEGKSQQSLIDEFYAKSMREDFEQELGINHSERADAWDALLNTLDSGGILDTYLENSPEELKQYADKRRSDSSENGTGRTEGAVDSETDQGLAREGGLGSRQQTRTLSRDGEQPRLQREGLPTKSGRPDTTDNDGLAKLRQAELSTADRESREAAELVHKAFFPDSTSQALTKPTPADIVFAIPKYEDLLDPEEEAKTAVQKFIYDGKRDVNVYEGAMNVMRTGYLLGFSVIKTNLAGNTANIAVEQLAKPAMAMADIINAKFNPKAKGMRYVPGLSLPDIVAGLLGKEGLIRGGILGERGVIKGVVHGVGELEASRVDMNEPNAKNPNFVRTTGFPIIDGIIEATKRLVVVVDRPFKAFARTAELRGMSRIAAKNLEKPKGPFSQEWRRTMKQFQKDPSMLMHDMAERYAETVTFQNPNAVTDLYDKFRKIVLDEKELAKMFPTAAQHRLVKHLGGMAYLASGSYSPFVKTPTNIGFRALEYLPTGIVSAAWKFYRIGQGFERTHWMEETAQARAKTLTKIASERSAADKEFRAETKKYLDGFKRRKDQRTEAWKKEIEDIKNSQVHTDKAKSEKIAAIRAKKKQWMETWTAKRTQYIEDRKGDYQDIDNRRRVADMQTRDEWGAEDVFADVKFRAFENKQFAEAAGRFGFGTVIGGLFLLSVIKGMMDAVGSTDYDDEKGKWYAKREAGIPDASVRIGKYRLPYNNNPFGMAMNIGLDQVEQFQRPGTNYARSGAMFKTLGKDVKALNPLTTGEFTKDDLNSWAGSKANSMTPILNLKVLQEVAEVMDEHPRKYWDQGFAAQYLIHIPKLRESLPASEHFIGGEAERGDLTRRFLRLLDPLKITREKNSQKFLPKAPLDKKAN